MGGLRVALAQRNMTVGDLGANVDRLVAAIEEASDRGCDLVATPELALTGYPPEDLVFKPTFVADNLAALEQVAAATTSAAAVVGFVDRSGDRLHNAAAICAGGRVVDVYHKRRLPNYAVFDEQRYFTPGSEPLVLHRVAGVLIGVTICEDAWAPGGPVAELAEGGAELIVHLNASPFHAGKESLRAEMRAARTAEAGCPIAYVNLVGGQDELVFDGGSVVVDGTGREVHRAASFVDELSVADIAVATRAAQPSLAVSDVTAPASEERAEQRAAVAVRRAPEATRAVYDAVVLGTRDYVRKNGFEEVVVGLSGGVDSTLVATVAVDALGPENVHGILLPSRYSSVGSVTDAEELAKRLGIDHRVVPIEAGHAALGDMLAPELPGGLEGVTDENLQSRLRGVVLMALSNQFGWMTLATSNKTESAVGYTTLYGDSVGGFAPINDVPKLLVYELCEDRNARAAAAGEIPPIPEQVLTKAPSAELRPDQRDDQSLPPYDVLDPLIEAYVEQDDTASDLIAAGRDPELVARIVRLVDAAEFKRRQSPPGPRVTTKAFGKDRRLPITNAYRGL